MNLNVIISYRQSRYIRKEPLIRALQAAKNDLRCHFLVSKPLAKVRTNENNKLEFDFANRESPIGEIIVEEGGLSLFYGIVTCSKKARVLTGIFLSFWRGDISP